MARLVGDDGSPHARLVLVGEAPGEREEAQGKPFVGPAGWRQDEWWRAVGLQRTDFYVTNVYPFRPPSNDIKAVDPHDLAAWVVRLHERLAALTDPWVIVPTGATALEALTGKRNILKHRGSIYAYEDRHGRQIKVISTIHPAATFRTPAWEARCRHDWRRIAADALFRELRLPVREHFTRPTRGDVGAFVRERLDQDRPLSLDIETPGGEVACIAFSADPAFSMTIPTTLDYWRDAATLAAVWDDIRALCESPVPKVTQNGLFDAYYLADRDITLRNWSYDTLAMHHALDPTEQHDLAYMASIDTRQPYWKDECKEPDEIAKYASNADALWTYNGIDASVQAELADVYLRRLVERGALGFYERHYRRMLSPLLSIMRRGVRLDGSARRRQFIRLTARCVDLQEKLAALCGAPLHATARNKKRDDAGRIPDLSHKKVADYLYGTLGLPRQTNRATGHVTTAEVSVRRLMLKYGMTRDGGAIDGRHVTEVCSLILDHRRAKKLSEFLDDGVVDVDGRMRCSYRFTTEMGRLSSGKNPRGTGRNLQNIDRELRDVFLPDEGCVFVEVDLSQAESRIVFALTGEATLIDLARRPPWEFDLHRRNASIIFKRPQDDITKEQRYLAKRGVHASHYGLRGTKLSGILLQDGYTYTPEECQTMIDTYLGQHAAVREWQRRTREAVMRDRCLVNSWGRPLPFDYDRLDDDTYRRAYAFVPQSEIADLLNQWGLIPLDAWLAAQGMASRINNQIHDALLISCPPNEVYAVMRFLRDSLERPRRYQGVELTIPAEFKLGRTWKGDSEFKRLPTEDEVHVAVGRLARLGT